MASEEKIRLILELVQQGDIKGATAQLEALKEKTEEVGSSSAQSGQKFLQMGRVIQDFTQGGIPGILNNIEGLTQSLGGGAGLAGIMTIVGVAAFIATPLIKKLWETVSEGGEQLKPLKERLEANTKALEEYGNQLKHTQEQVDAYNKSLAEKERLQAEEGRRALEAAGLKQVTIPDAAAKARGERFAAAVGGDMLGTTRAIQSVMQDQFDRENKATLDAMAKLETQIMPEELRGHRRKLLERQLTKQPGEIERDAATLVGRAAAGEAPAISQLARMFPGRRGIQEATEGAQQQRVVDDMLTEQGAETRKQIERQKKIRQENLKKRAAAQQAATDEALRGIDEWSLEKPMIEEQERLEAEHKRQQAQHQAETARQKAERAAKDAQARQAMAESTELVQQAAMQNTPMDVQSMVNPNAIHHAAQEALRMWQNGFGSGQQAAIAAWAEEVASIRAQMSRMAPSINGGIQGTPAMNTGGFQ